MHVAHAQFTQIPASSHPNSHFRVKTHSQPRSSYRYAEKETRRLERSNGMVIAGPKASSCCCIYTGGKSTEHANTQTTDYCVLGTQMIFGQFHAQTQTNEHLRFCTSALGDELRLSRHRIFGFSEVNALDQFIAFVEIKRASTTIAEPTKITSCFGWSGGRQPW